MIRIILWNLFIFAAPFLVALFWLAVMRRVHPSEATLKLWVVTGCVGLALMLASLYFWRTQLGVPPGYEYVPPHYEKGRLVPGHFDKI